MLPFELSKKYCKKRGKLSSEIRLTLTSIYGTALPNTPLPPETAAGRDAASVSRPPCERGAPHRWGARGSISTPPARHARAPLLWPAEPRRGSPARRPSGPRAGRGGVASVAPVAGGDGQRSRCGFCHASLPTSPRCAASQASPPPLPASSRWRRRQGGHGRGRAAREHPLARCEARLSRSCRRSSWSAPRSIAAATTLQRLIFFPFGSRLLIFFPFGSIFCWVSLWPSVLGLH
jgi:hypothetical protein